MKRHYLSGLLCVVMLMCVATITPATVLSNEYVSMNQLVKNSDGYFLGCKHEEILYGESGVECDSVIYSIQGDYLLSDSTQLIPTTNGDNLNKSGGCLYYTEYVDGVSQIAKYDVTGGSKKVLLKYGDSPIKNMYVVCDSFIMFLAGGIVYQCGIDCRNVERVSPMEDVFGFIPTYSTTIYATGEVLDYAIYADAMLILDKATYYNVITVEKGTYFVATVDGCMRQLNIKELEQLAKIYSPNPADFMDEFNLYGVYDVTEIFPDSETNECETCVQGDDGEVHGEVHEDKGARADIPDRNNRSVVQVAPTQRQTIILNRAHNLAYVEWTPLVSFRGYKKSSNSYIAGQQEYMLPYSRPSRVAANNNASLFYTLGGFVHRYVGDFGEGAYISVLGFCEAVADEYSEFNEAADSAACNSAKLGALYGVDCSGFVSHAWGVQKYGAANFTGGKVSEAYNFMYGIISPSNLVEINPGDVFAYSNSEGGHCILIKSVFLDSQSGNVVAITTLEEISPRAVERTYGSAASNYGTLASFVIKLNNKGYKGYRLRNGVEVEPYAVMTFFNSGTDESFSPLELRTGNQYGTLPAPSARTGYTFGGWWTAEVGGQRIFSSTSMNRLLNHTLYARWIGNEYTVLLTPNGGTRPIYSMMVTFGRSYGNFMTFTRTGYTFAGWYKEQGFSNPVISSTIVDTPSDHALYAKWNAKQYTVAFNPSGGLVSPATKTVTYDSTYGTMPTPAKPLFIFLGWYTKPNGGGVRRFSNTTVATAANHTLYARWVPESDLPPVV